MVALFQIVLIDVVMDTGGVRRLGIKKGGNTMARHIRKYLLVLFGTLALVAVSAILVGDAVTDVAAQAQASEAKTLTRDLEPAIVKGAQVTRLVGTPVDDLFVYKFSGDSLSGQIPMQVDEVTASGSYTTTEDSLLDANDEIVFMAMDLGDRPSDFTVLADTLPISATWYEIEVWDPLSPSQKGWAYLVRSSTLTPGFSDDYVNITPGGQGFTIDADQYELRFSTAFPIINYLAMNGSGVDILDRTKIRTIVDVLGIPVTFNEEDLESPETVLIKDGPVRGILSQTALASPGGPISEANLDATNLVYASMLQATVDISFTLPGLADLTYARTSVDFNSAADGATFYNDNTPGGVTIDGSPDTLDATPLSNWAQVSHSTGRLVNVSDPSLAGGTQTNYYCDDGSGATTECDGTPTSGDGVSYGDVGISIEGDITESFTAESSLYVLPSPGGDQDNVGNTYEDYHFNPLITIARLRAVQGQIFLPMILKNSQ
jgi:hypothetical protein